MSESASKPLFNIAHLRGRHPEHDAGVTFLIHSSVVGVCVMASLAWPAISMRATVRTTAGAGVPEVIWRDAHIRDCFRAAGYAPDLVGVYAAFLRKRIAALNAL